MQRGAAGRAFGGMVALVALAGGIVWASRDQPTTTVVGSSAATWLSGEAKGRIVLVTAGSERPSLAVSLGTSAGTTTAAYDLADLGRTVVVQDRSTGTVITVDGASGAELSRTTGPVPSDSRPVLTPAGGSAYLVDVAAQTAKRLTATGTALPSVPVGRGFTDWVGTTDGTLWLLNRTDGLSATFDGSRVRHNRLTRPNADLDLTSVGNEAVVLDRDTMRVRWLRHSTSQEVPTTPRDVVAGSGGSKFQIEPDHVVVQQPDPAADCLAIVTQSALACMTPNGLARLVTFDEVTFKALPDIAGARLFADDTDAVLVWPNRADIAVLSWADGRLTAVSRGAPSARPAVAWTAGGAIVIDDPASRNALIIDRGVARQLDKFSRGTIVISPSGVQTDTGVGTGSDEGDISAVVEGAPPGASTPDDNDQPDAPIANPDRAVTRSGRSIVLGVLGNDSDPDGDPMRIVSAGPLSPDDGIVNVVEGSVLNYRAPSQSFDRTITFPYRIADVGNLEDSTTVTVELIGSGRNTSPQAVDDDATTTANTSIDIPVLANDTDDEGDPLTISAIEPPEHGSAAIGNDDTVRYEPDPGFTGRDGFTYTVVDGYGGERTARVRIEVTTRSSANRAPVAADDRTATVSGARVRVDALANDDDPDGDALRIVSIASLPGVKAAIVDGTSVDITPDDKVAGLLQLSYTIADSGGLQDTATIEIVVQNPPPQTRNEPPIAVDDRGSSAGAPVTVDVVANDTDPGGGELAVIEVSQPALGTGTAARLSPRTVQFVPQTGFIGTARFTYRVTNENGLSATATVTIQVTPPSGSGPVARDDSITIFSGDTATIAVLANDTHPDGLPFDIVGLPVVRGGTAIVNADNSITFTPPTNDPATYTLTYTIQDVNGARSSATVFVTVVAKPTTNRPPTPADDLTTTGYQTVTLIDVLANDTDPDGSAVTLSSVTPPNRGSATVVGDKVRYTPPAGFSGLVSFAYTVADPQGATATATITVQVIDRVKIPPVASPDLVTMVVGTQITVDPTGNDVDPDGATAALVVGQIGTPTPSGGPTAALVSGGVRIVAGGTVGAYDIAYTVVDPDGLSANGTITVLVQLPPNQPPQAADDTLTMLAVPTTIDVLANDTDPDGGALTITALGPVSPSGAGNASIRSSGTAIDLVPAPGFAGEISFAYTIRDNRNATSTARVVATVSACPALPSLTSVSATTSFNTPTAIALFSGAPPDGAVSISAPSSGSAVLNTTTNVVQYTPANGFNGVATFSYSVRSICNAVATATVSVIVNRAPTANADVATTDTNRSVVIDVAGNDTDPDLDLLTVRPPFSNQFGGSASLNSDGRVLFTPAPSFKGEARFSYTIADIGGLTDVGQVTVYVSNSPPTAVSDTTTTFTQATSVTYDVIANDTDPNNDNLVLASVGSVSPSGAGTATISGNRIAFQPAADLGPGPVSITYVVSDGDLTDTGLLVITVQNQPPIAVGDAATLDTSVAASIDVDVVANDIDPDGSTSGLTLTNAAVLPSAGSVTWSSTVITFTPDPGAGPGTVLIQYTISDQYGAVSQGTLTITVT